LEKWRKNPRTRIGISSFRSRNGGIVMRTTLRAEIKIVAEFSFAHQLFEILFVAAMIRKSACNVLIAPTRSNARFLAHDAQQFLTWVPRVDLGPLRRGKSWPPLACSNRPMRRSYAPVKRAFLREPNNSLSRSCGKKAPRNAPPQISLCCARLKL